MYLITGRGGDRAHICSKIVSCSYMDELMANIQSVVWTKKLPG